jgi:hypothetical protein
MLMERRIVISNAVLSQRRREHTSVFDGLSALRAAIDIAKGKHDPLSQPHAPRPTQGNRALLASHPCGHGIVHAPHHVTQSYS